MTSHSDPAQADGLAWRVPAVADELSAVRIAVTSFAAGHGAPADVQSDIALAVSEACANAVLHAYVDDPEPGALIVEAFRRNGELVIVIGDEGRGMVPRVDSPGLGLGLALIGRLAARLEIDDRTTAPGTRLQMTFALAGGVA